jgi:hypothetical protein
MMFVHDGQSHFSLYRNVARSLTAALGPNGAAFTMACINSVVWLLSFSYLARQFVDIRPTWLPTLFVSVLPLSYGGYHILHAGELFAIPRPLAEAFVFLALAFILQRRLVLALAGFTLAAAFHPIMSLAGLAVGLMLVVRRATRLIAVVSVLSAIILGLAISGASVFDRLLVLVDPEWQALLKTRHPYLYPTLWNPEVFARTALSVTTLYMASRLSTGAVKRLFVAAAIVGPLGLAASAVFGDVFSLLLVEQAQLWRMEWITTTLGAASLALIGLKLWPRHGLYRLSFALLAFGWISDNESYVGFLVAPMALGLNHLAERSTIVLRRSLEIAILAIGSTLLVVAKITELATTTSLSPPDVAQEYLANVTKAHLLSLPLIAFAFTILWRPPRRGLNFIVLGAIATTVIALIFLWDNRRPSEVMLYTRMRDPALTKIIDAHPGEIFWMDGYEPWYLLGRPNWALQVQGAGGVFSRELSTIFAERIHASINAGLLPPGAAHPYDPVTAYDVPNMSRAGVDLICARRDAPAWIVMPLPNGVPPPPGVATHMWHAPYTKYVARLTPDALTWPPISDYVLAACAEQRHMAP